MSTLNQTTTHIDIVNSTIVSNYNNYDWIAGTGAIVVAGNTAVTRVVNSIIWGNKMGENYQNIRLADGAPGFSIQNSIVQDSFDDEGEWNQEYGENLGGNLIEMPEFLDFIEAGTEPFSDGDFSLMEGSIGVDSGNMGAYSELVGELELALDVAGNFRFYGEGIDIGAYEFGAGSPTFVYGNFEMDDLKVYPNPTTGIIRISGLQKPASFLVYDITGKLLKVGSLSGFEAEPISLETKPSGIYLLQIVSSGKTNNKVVIVE